MLTPIGDRRALRFGTAFRGRSLSCIKHQSLWISMANDVPAERDSGAMSARFFASDAHADTYSDQLAGAWFRRRHLLHHDGIATVSFYHPKSNSLPASLPERYRGTHHGRQQASGDARGGDPERGRGSFCAGASFDELKRIDSPEAWQGVLHGLRARHHGNAPLPKPIITRCRARWWAEGVGYRGRVGLRDRGSGGAHSSE
jgi:hypothetical protein